MLAVNWLSKLNDHSWTYGWRRWESGLMEMNALLSGGVPAHIVNPEVLRP